MDYKALAKQFGAVETPAQPSSAGYVPFMGELSPKDQSEVKMKIYQEGRKRLADLDIEISRAEPTVNALERFGQLNRQSKTGGVWESFLPSVPFLHGQDENEMFSIQAGLGPSQRIEGSGTSTDRDVNLFLAGLPRVENKGPVNKNIRTNFKNKYDYAVKKRSAMQVHLDKYGHLNGFDSEWAGLMRGAPQPTAVQQPAATNAVDELLKKY